ncbi:uncharacterized protein LOC116944409 isoform X2 [Petromyzon marinus]|uniref:uncharacterized protein LOC116944409 isoform X2 n=1 Tax=Petromyzon marinus TaxID=7757 RepID=UPI003F70E181
MSSCTGAAVRACAGLSYQRSTSSYSRVLGGGGSQGHLPRDGGGHEATSTTPAEKSSWTQQQQLLGSSRKAPPSCVCSEGCTRPPHASGSCAGLLSDSCSTEHVTCRDASQIAAFLQRSRFLKNYLIRENCTERHEFCAEGAESTEYYHLLDACLLMAEEPLLGYEQLYSCCCCPGLCGPELSEVEQFLVGFWEAAVKDICLEMEAAMKPPQRPRRKRAAGPNSSSCLAHPAKRLRAASVQKDAQGPPMRVVRVLGSSPIHAARST